MLVHDTLATSPANAREREWTRYQALPASASVVLAAGYGLLSHAVFRSGWLDDRLNVMSAGFFFLCPFSIGFLAVVPRRSSRARWCRAGTSLLACSLVIGSTALLSLEPLLFIVMALPVLLTMAGLGGLASCVVSRRWASTVPRQHLAAVIAVIAPFGVAYAESFAPPDSVVRTVHTEVTISASRNVIWKNITRVSEIQPHEQRFSILHALGLPRPREAVLSRDGVGGIRDATFAGGLSFVETVTRWQHEHELQFTIEVDRAKPIPDLINAIDDVYFTVTDGTYRIEATDRGGWILNLDSTQRLKSRFNWYASFWTDRIMLHLQDYILRIIRERCEGFVDD